MATIALSVAGNLLGNLLLPGIGGTIGQALGAMAGSAIDMTILNALTPKKPLQPPTNINVAGASEDSVVPQSWGLQRLGGNVIWATHYKVRQVKVAGTGKGNPFAPPEQKRPQYVVSFAVAFCQGGEDVQLRRLWADGNELDQTRFVIRFYKGTEDQLPDSLIQSTEGTNNTPAFRGICYVVFDSAVLDSFGGRIPQISAEIVRRPPASTDDLNQVCTGVVLGPGTGEFSLGTSVYITTDGQGNGSSANAHTAYSTITDLTVSLNDLQEVLPNLKTVVVQVAWFGNDLRAGNCTVAPRVRVSSYHSVKPSDWRCAGLSRGDAQVVSQVSAQVLDPTTFITALVPAFDGTPSDAVVQQCVAALQGLGLKVVICPILLMDIPPGNLLVDPYTGSSPQKAFPLARRITCSPAPGVGGTVDKTATAATQINAFFVSYDAFVSHYASLIPNADGFIIGVGLKGLTQVRSTAGDGTYPAVVALRTLAATIRGTVEGACKIGYMANWDEWHSHQPGDGTGDIIFNLDPLWMDSNIDWVGVNALFPLSDWRDIQPNKDYNVANPLDPHNMAYLKGNVLGGELYDWAYLTDTDRATQQRTMLKDTNASHEDWVLRYKDLPGWWTNQHHSRPGGVRNAGATSWTAQAKPVWYMLGCPAVDKGSNQPSTVWDPKSGDSALPYFGRLVKDDPIQRAYIEAQLTWWRDNSPPGMLSVDNMLVCSWDARPYPDYPTKATLWSDYILWDFGMILTARLMMAPLKWVIQELAGSVGAQDDVDVDHLEGATTLVGGYATQTLSSPRDVISQLMDVLQFDAWESQGLIRFGCRGSVVTMEIDSDYLITEEDTLGANQDLGYQLVDNQETDLPSTVAYTFMDPYNQYNRGSVQARRNLGNSQRVLTVTTDLVQDQSQAKGIADVLLQQSWEARQTGTLKLSPALIELDPGDGILLNVLGGQKSYRIKQLGTSLFRSADVIGYDPSQAQIPVYPTGLKRGGGVAIFGESIVEFIEFPLLTGQEDFPWAPRIAAFSNPWSGVNVFKFNGTGYDLATTVVGLAAMGELIAPLPAGPIGRWDKGNVLQVVFYGETNLMSRIDDSILAGFNSLAVKGPNGDWELVQFVNATLTGVNQYSCSRLIRGQSGTEGAMGNPTPTGSRVVFIDATSFGVLPMKADEMGLAQQLSYGPAALDLSSEAYQTVSLTFKGEGLRPYSPMQVEGRRVLPVQDIVITWIRRTRFAGDNFDLAIVPVNEDTESYDLEVLDGGGNVIRTVTGLSVPTWTYTAAMQVADWGTPLSTYTLNVYQNSILYGRGQVLKSAVVMNLPGLEAVG